MTTTRVPLYLAKNLMAHGTALFHVRLNALCTDLADALMTFAACPARTQTKREPTRKIGALPLQKIAMRVHSSIVRIL